MMIVNLLAPPCRGGEQVSGIRILMLALLLIGTTFGCAPEAKTSVKSAVSTSSATASPSSPLAAGATKATIAADMDWLRQKATETKGDFARLSAEEQARVQAITKGHGTEVLKGMALSK